MNNSFKKSFQLISNEELGGAWLKIKNKPGKTLQILQEKESSFLYELILTLYYRGIIKSDDWVLLERYIDCRTLFSRMIKDERTRNQFISGISDLFDQVTRDSKDFWQNYWEEPLLDLDHYPKFSFAPDRIHIPAMTENSPELASEPVQGSTHPKSRNAHSQYSMWKLQQI